MNDSVLEVIRSGRPSPARPALLFVHGANVGAWCWEEHFLDYFSNLGHECLAVSLRGHGASPSRGLFPPGIADYVSDVKDIACTLPVPPILIGHSMGARVVEEYLLVRPVSAASTSSAMAARS